MAQLIYNNNTLSIEANTLSTNTQTGALVVKGGVGIQENLNVGSTITAI